MIKFKNMPLGEFTKRLDDYIKETGNGDAELTNELVEEIFKDHIEATGWIVKLSGGGWLAGAMYGVTVKTCHRENAFLFESYDEAMGALVTYRRGDGKVKVGDAVVAITGEGGF